MSQPYSIESLTLECPICGETENITDYDTGEEICINCGCVTNDAVMMKGITSQDYSFRLPEAKHHHGPPKKPSFYDYGMNTFMVGKVDAYGLPIKPEMLKEMRRLQRRDKQTKMDESASRNLSFAMAELDRLVTSLSLPNHVKEKGAFIYRKALEMDLIRGRSIDAFVAASLYAACRMNNVPRQLRAVARESKREYKEVSMTYRMIIEELSLKPPIDKPQKYIPELAQNLEIPRQTEIKANEILRDAGREKALVGKDPRGIAAAALYLASELCGERVVQSKIAKAAKTTEVTLRTRYRGLKEALNIV